VQIDPFDMSLDADRSTLMSRLADLAELSTPPLTDTWKASPKRINEGIATFNSFKGPNPNGARIDWILSRGDVTTDKAEIITFVRDGQYPSDHFPIAAWVQLGAGK
jgi:endonuclease/exonuclease/phosphatase family metal-dependent hydrolase